MNRKLHFQKANIKSVKLVRSFHSRLLFAIDSCHSSLRLVWQEPEPSQATDMALACCFLGRVLGVGCHYFPLPLDIPTTSARREILVAKGGIMGENIVW